MSGIVNKIKEAVHSDKSHSHSSAPEGTHGPHNSRVANAADPRVDSDRDGSNTMGNTGAGRTANPLGSSTTTGRTAGPMGSSGTAEGAHGPHNSRVTNAMDPRVDSDRDGSNTMGGAGGMGMGNFGSTGMTGTTGASGFGSGSTGMTGTHGAPAGAHGPHNSRVGNTLDPRVDSDRDGRGALGTGPGPAPNTAGPHKSDMMNKADPRVDSDLDGSKTMGGNKTFGQ